MFENTNVSKNKTTQEYMDSNKENVHINRISNDSLTESKNSSSPDMTSSIETFVKNHKVIPYGIEIETKKSENQLQFYHKKIEQKRRKMWTDIEIFFLKKGVGIHGIGSWKQILETYKNFFSECRRPVDLKDKYRIISKRTSLTNKRKHEYIEVDVNKKAIDTQIYRKKFPGEAAYTVAMIKGTDEMIIRIALKSSFCETLGMYSQVYEYFVNVIEGKMTVKRIVETKKP